MGLLDDKKTEIKSHRFAISGRMLPASDKFGACPAGASVAFPDAEHITNTIGFYMFMGMEYKIFTVAAPVKIQLFKNKEMMRRTAVIRGNYTLFPAEHIICKTHELTLHAIFA
jgi:hypothetical protein